ncbi:fucolectin-like [Mytilus trossulus]|uniref:fucolectin-like n=1 Tax=Mytilus trossulus TaxID=6551 RepID=UPI003006D29A
MMDSLKARQDDLQTELKEYSSNLSISAEYFDKKIIHLVRDVEGKFDSMFLNMTSHYKQKVNILSDRLNKEFIDFQLSTEEWKNNITHTSSDQYIFEVSLHGKHTEQSSNYLSSFPASNAIDGHLSTFSHTSPQTNPFWILDLGTVYKVKMIKVFARTDCCGNYIHDMDITVGPTTNNMTLCTHYNGPASTKDQLVLKCKKPVDGRFVKLSISTKNAVMALAEVKVFACV